MIVTTTVIDLFLILIIFLALGCAGGYFFKPNKFLIAGTLLNHYHFKMSEHLKNNND
jgi:hypothetical protein